MQDFEVPEIDPFDTDLQKHGHRKIETEVNGSAVTYSITATHIDPLDQLTSSRQVVRDILVKELKKMGGVKYTETLKVRMSKEVGEGKTKKESKTGTVTNFEDIECTAAANQQMILSRIDTFQNMGSNWRIMNLERHYVNIAMYKPLKGNSYMKLPEDISNPKSGLVNIRNDDALCFLWCHVRDHRPKKNNATYITTKDIEYRDDLDYEGIEFPVKVSDIGKIEKKNKINITVLGNKGKKQFYPIRISKEEYEDHMELLLLGDGEGGLHYVLIKDVNRLLCSVTKNKTKKHFCLNCFHNCESEESLANHKETCSQVNGVQAVKLPKEGTKIKFKNHKNQLPVPFVIYADFESLVVSDKDRKLDDTVDESYTNRYQTHHACSLGLKRVCHYDDPHSGEYTSYIGKDASYRFLKAVLKEAEMCNQIMRHKFKKPMTITDEQESEFQAATKCHICCGEMEGDDKVRDHCHVTGKYRGAAHNKCNLNHKLTWKIPVVFHNLKGYDSHLIMQEIGNFGLEVNVIPNNMKKYLSFSLGKHLVFIDSTQFMASSLESLASFLPKEEFFLVGQRWQGEDINLVTQKGIFPYEFMSRTEKLKTKQLPEKKHFYSTLYESDVSDEDYERAQRVWKHFKMKTMRDYHDLYLETDVLLLADVFENFRKTCLKNYGLDPAHYVSAPGLSWDVFLKRPGANIELVSDMDMFQFFEKGMRGGTSYIAHRYAKANNKYMSTYDKNKQSNYLMYLDANNLYGWAMSQPLPYGDFKWVENTDEIRYKDYLADSDRGMVLEVDLEYPKKLHRMHNGYPLAPESKEITKDMLSDYAREIADKYNITVGGVKKLVTTLGPRKKYVLHVRNLDMYVAYGMVLTKVHRAVTFKQSRWLEDYIDYNTKMRTSSKNTFEKNFFKLMNNSIYGKTMENVRKRVDVKLVTTETEMLRSVSSPHFQ